MKANDSKKIIGKPIAIGLVTLILGVVMGVTAEHYGHKTLTARPPRVAAKATLPAAPSGTTVSPKQQVAEWDPFQEMRDLQAEMDQMFQSSIEHFHSYPQMNLFKDRAGYSLSLDVRDRKDRYEVRAVLPDAKASNAKVKLEQNRLSVDVTDEQTEKQSFQNGQAMTTELGNYEQVIQLAGSLKSSQMKIERKKHELLITIPKA